MQKAEIELPDRILIFDLRLLRKLQAVWRGAVVRKRLLSLRAEYETAIKEIEGPECALQITWEPDLFLPPSFAKSSTPGLNVITIEKTVCTVQKEESSSSISPLTTSVDPISEKPTEDSEISEEVPKNDDDPTDKKVLEHNEKYVHNSQDIPEQIPKEKQLVVSSKDLCNDINKKESTELEKGDSNKANNDFSCSLHPNTEFWDTLDIDSTRIPLKIDLSANRDSLLKEKEEISMELLWIQQAIDSRKQYLRLRQEMEGGAT